MLKKLLSFVGLGVFAITSAAAGLLLAKAPEANEVKADEPNTWMFRAQLNLGVISPSRPDPAFEIEHVKLHYWGDGDLDAYADASFMFTNPFDNDYYGVNISLPDSQTVNGMQWVVTQTGVGDKYSVNLEKFGDEAVTQLNKDSSLFIIEHQFDNEWTGDHWNPTNDVGYVTGYIRLEVGTGDYDYFYFTKDPASNTFKLNDFTLTETKAMDLDVDGNVYLSHVNLFDEASLPYIEVGQPNWWWMDEGTYNFVLKDGEVAVRKHAKYLGEIYLVNITEDAYIYTFGEGGEEEFGAFPGTRLGDIGMAADIKGALKFQGNDWDLHSLCLYMGYPAADHLIVTYLNEHGHPGYQTADMLLKNGSAYWCSDDPEYHNDDAGKALWFLELAESYREDADGKSVCNISKAEAAALVDDYNLLSEDVRTYYVDCTTVTTYRRDGEPGTEDVPYRAVMEELAKIAEVELVGVSRPITTSGSVTITAIVGIIAIIAVASISAVFVVVTLKKKHE